MAPTLLYETMTQLTRERINKLKNRLRDDTTPDQEGTATPSPEPQKPPATNAATETTAEPSSGVSPGQEDNAKESCDCPPSPDGKFAFLASDTEENSFGEQLQIIDLIDRKSGKKLQRVDDAAMPVFWNVLWAPDSNGFALMTKVVGHPRLQGVDVYFLSGETFQKIELPDLPDANIAKEVVWAPDSKRFAFNYTIYSPRNDYETVAFYQLRGDKWVALHSPVEEGTERLQLAQFGKGHLPKDFNSRRCAPDNDVLKLRKWTDANTAILYAPCYGRKSGELEAGFLFTLKFDDAGKWKIVDTHRMSKKELGAEQ
jgi:hypothetical protein